LITVYSKNQCPYWLQAKNLLNAKGIQFTEVKIDEDAEARKFVLSQGHRTVPQIYQDGKLLVEGGYTGLTNSSYVIGGTVNDVNSGTFKGFSL
jgi:glutaredoxin 3